MKRVIKTMIGILLFIAGISIFLYPEYREWKMGQEIETILEAVRDGKETEGDHDHSIGENEFQLYGEPEEENGSDDHDDRYLDGLLQILKEYNFSLPAEGQGFSETWDFKQIPIDITSWNQGSHMLGYIEIPEIFLKLPLYVGATDHNMSNGAAVLAGTSMPIGGIGSNCVIAAHRGWSGSP